MPKCLEIPRFQPQRAPAHRWRQDLDARAPIATQTVPKCLEMPRFQPQRAPAHRWRQDLDARAPIATQTVPKCLETPRFQPQKAPAHRWRQEFGRGKARPPGHFPVSTPRNLQHDPCYMKTSILIREVAVCVGGYLRSPTAHFLHSETPGRGNDVEMCVLRPQAAVMT